MDGEISSFGSNSDATVRARLEADLRTRSSRGPGHTHKHERHERPERHEHGHDHAVRTRSPRANEVARDRDALERSHNELSLRLRLDARIRVATDLDGDGSADQVEKVRLRIQLRIDSSREAGDVADAEAGSITRAQAELRIALDVRRRGFDQDGDSSRLLEGVADILEGFLDGVTALFGLQDTHPGGGTDETPPSAGDSSGDEPSQEGDPAAPPVLDGTPSEPEIVPPEDPGPAGSGNPRENLLIDLRSIVSAGLSGLRASLGLLGNTDVGGEALHLRLVAAYRASIEAAAAPEQHDDRIHIGV